MVAFAELNDDQRLYLQTIFGYFCEYGKWPTHQYLDQLFLQTHPELDIEEIGQSLPRGLTDPMKMWNADSKATLTASAIYQCWGSVQELETFVQVIELCVDTYMTALGEDVRISSDDVARYHPLWKESAIHKVGSLLSLEHGIWSIFMGPEDDGSWSCKLERGIRRFRGVKTIEEYLEKCNKLKKDTTTKPNYPDALRHLVGHIYSKPVHPQKKDIEAGTDRWEQDLTKAETDGGKLEMALLNALTRLGIPTLFSGSSKYGGTERYAYDLVALRFFEKHQPTAILISCKSNYNQPNLGEIGKLCEAVEQVKLLLGSDWSVFGALAILGSTSLSLFNNQQDYRLWKKPHLQAILHAHNAESLDSMLWTPPQHWNPESESIWRNIYSSFHKDIPEEILGEVMTI
jgi:hypothetical protein